jgi:predicted nucleic acid-binding protein
MKELKYFVDTNIFLRPIIKDDPQKLKECEEFFKRVKEGKIRAFTSNLVLAEIIWTGLSFYKINKKELVNVLKGILDFKNLKIVDNFNPRLALKIYEKTSIKFIDALIASNPEIYQRKVNIVSYDKDFDKLKIKRLEPKKII